MKLMFLVPEARESLRLQLDIWFEHRANRQTVKAGFRHGDGSISHAMGSGGTVETDLKELKSLIINP